MKKTLTLIVVLAIALGLLPAMTSAQDTPTLLIWADETRASVVEELGASFEEEYGVDLVVQQMDMSGIRDQLRVAGPAGEGPDIIVGPHDWVGELVQNGLVAPVDLGDAAELFSPVAITAFTWDGQLYGVPYAIENIALFYNTDIIETPPATFEELATMAQEAVDSGKAEYGYVRESGDPYHFYPIMTGFGGYIFGRDEMGNYTPEDIGVGNEGSVAALEYVQGLVADGILTPGMSADDAKSLFYNGKAAMYITGPWSIQGAIDAGLNFAVAPSPAGPAGPGAPFLGVQAFMVSAFSENQALALAFLTEFVASEEVQLALYEEGQRSPALLSAQEMIEDPYLAAISEAGAVGQPMPNIPAMSAVWGPAGDMITLAQNDPEADAAELAAQAAEAIQTAVEAE